MPRMTNWSSDDYILYRFKKGYGVGERERADSIEWSGKGGSIVGVDWRIGAEIAEEEEKE